MSRAIDDRRLAECVSEIALGTQDLALVAAWADRLDAEIPAIAERYYAHLRTTEVGTLLTPDRIDRLLAARIAHWRLLVRGDFAALAEDYAERFGKRLFEAGFPQRIFVAATHWFVVEIGRFVDRATDLPDAIRSDLRVALTRFAFLDLALAHASREVAYLD